jgi:phage-related tail protein
MNTVLLNTGVVVFIIYALVSIVYQVSAYRAAVALRQFIRLSSGDLLTTLAEFRTTLEDFRKISDNVTMVTQNVREITSSVADLQQEVGTVYGIIKDRAGAEARADLAGLKAGIKTGVATLVQSIKEERSDEHERGT